ncbi:MAG TPA: hypothetical protein VEW90_03880 [Gaiellaceae bacterium]|nr:hypothetical protein [Gaiellaceae bacterium]
MNVASVVATAFVAIGVAADVETSDFRYKRPLNAPAAGPVVFEPDGAMYGHSSQGFSDLRVVDAGGTQVPWRTAPLPDAVPARQVDLVARGELDGLFSVVLDRGTAAEVVDRIELIVPDREFVGEVEVLGSTTGAEGSYATLSTTQIYAVRGAVNARSTTALFPPTDYRYLLVQARGVSRIDGATVARDPREPPLDPVDASSTASQSARSTVVTLDLGFVNVPVDAVEISSRTDRFVRRVVVEGSNDNATFASLGSGEIARFRGVDLGRIAIAGDQRYLRVTIANGDDAPLAALRVTALARPRPLLLAEGHTPPFAVYYGATALAAPAYDFAQLPASALGVERAVAGTLGPEVLNDDFAPPADTRTFFEKNRSAVNALLVLAALVVAVGGVLALRRRS